MCICTMHTQFLQKGPCTKAVSDACEVVVRRHSSKAFVAIGFALARNRRLAPFSGPYKEIKELGGFFARDFVFLYVFGIFGFRRSLVENTIT